MYQYSVIVVTHNRASVLQDTLAALARIEYARPWQVIVVDNNSTDETATVVENVRHAFPVALRYLFEGTPGKYHALNAGIAASESPFIAATDDDACPEPDWLSRADEGFDARAADFVGGPVYPVWGAPPPTWVNWRTSICGKVLALLDHGPTVREFGRGGLSWPLGVNVAYRRSAFDRVGLFDGRLGRVAGTLRNQSQREWHLRARDAGLCGFYLPRMVVHHSVEAERLTRRYFHRWFYWHGISRAIMYQQHGLHLLEPESRQTHRHERHIAGVPLSLWRTGWRALLSAGKRWALLRTEEAVEFELMVSFCAGVVRQRWRDRRIARDAARASRSATAA